MSVLRKSNQKASSRQQIRIKGVQDGVLLLPGEEYRMILEASSLNFELKSDDEQDAIIDGYQSFLNALPGSVQIVARIRALEIDRYLADFRKAASGEENEIYRQQIDSYTEFVESLVTTHKVLSRRYFIVIPFTNSGHASFDTVLEKLTLSRDIVTKGLNRLGIQTRPLSSLELLELFYSFYRPVQAKRQPLTAQTMQLLHKSYW